MILDQSRLKPIQSLDDLLKRTLRDQQDLSAVERFSQEHDSGASPAQAKYYKNLMPASPPGERRQYAFEVDLDKCTGCKACVSACHNLNGLEKKETWRSTGLLLGGSMEDPYQQTVTTACHHCLDPACLNGCPVNAYEKSTVTGIVKHLDDQCIGCKYCTLTCPYDVPQYSRSKGIVRKCDMCSDRLSDGEAPACVQACPTQAIRIQVVDVEQTIENCEAGQFLPGAPSSELTMPTTVYKTKKVMPLNLLPADYHKVKREASHMPLVVMLVLTQLSVGTFLAEWIMQIMTGRDSMVIAKPVYSIGALLLGFLALGASLFHLGRPHLAFRAILGLKRSWLSREILLFGVYALAATGYAASFWLDTQSWLQQVLYGLTLAAGTLGIFSSVMVYYVTRRAFWQQGGTGFKFFATAWLLGFSLLLLGSATSICINDPSSLKGFIGSSGRSICWVIMGLTVLKLFRELSILVHLKDTLHSPLRRTAALMVGPLKNRLLLRLVCAGFGGLAIPGLMIMTAPVGLQQGWMMTWLTIGFVMLLVGELLERYLFFTTGIATRMPGGQAR